MLRRLGHLLMLVSLLVSLFPSAMPVVASAASAPAAHSPSRALLSPSSLTQTTEADFGACDSPSTTAVVGTGGGAVQLAGALADTFAETDLDAQRWQWGSWGTGSYTPSLSSGTVDVDAADGAWIRSQQPLLAAAVEATLTFGAAPWQHVGFGSDGFVGNHYAFFSTYNTSNRLYARLDNNSGSEQRVDLGALPSGAHRYRIAWTKAITSDQLQFFLDDALVADLTIDPLPPLYVYLSNDTPGTPLLVDAVQTMPPFAGSGAFVSCPFDAGASTTWQTLSWTADMPAGTQLGAETRTSLDGELWSAWHGLDINGGALSNPAGRYLQYRLTLATDDTQYSPLVTAVAATYDGAASAPAAGETLTHTTDDDFMACGGLSDTAISSADDGGLRLSGGLRETFDAVALDTGRWQAGTWRSGSYPALPSDGTIDVEASGGAWIRSQQTFTETAVEANLTFGAAPWQHVGFGSDQFVGDVYALFSTYNTTTTLYARLNNNGSEQRVSLGAIPSGSHRYRVAWRSAGSTDQVTFYRDGVLVASLLVTPLPPLYVYLSNDTPGTSLLIDDVQTPLPFVSSGSFLSCPFDAGAEVEWQALTWAADTPVTTTLDVEARSSADASSWSSWSSVTAGAALSVPDGRYLQYRLALTTSDAQLSPLVFAVAAQHEAVVVASPTPADLLPTADTNLPSLTVKLAVAPDPLAVGSTAAFTLTLSNQSENLAEDVLVSLPTPDGALALSGPIISSPFVGWQWDVGELAAQSSLELTASLELQSMPGGKALLFEAQATAAGLDVPIFETGGALVFDPLFGPASAVYTPTATLLLTSTDGALTLEAPPAAASVPLTLTISTTPPPDADESPEVAGFQLGFGTFYLNAADPAGDAVHNFSQPLTLTMRYTPEQLRVRGLAEHDLTLFWFDPTVPVTDTAGSMTLGAWQPVAVALDPASQTATALISHFSNFQLSDGSSPSAAFIPSLQGFQVSSFTGAASYSYPIDVPAGPAGLKPNLALSYSSASADGAGGQRIKQQAGWVGQGWTLDTGSVAANKLPNGEKSYSMVVDGQSYDLVRGAALVGSPSLSDPTDWDWRPTDESFIRVRVIGNGVSTSTRGGFSFGAAYPRYTWQMWAKDGTRYDFSDDMWWGWEACGDTGDYAYMEASRWLLTRVTDTHGNTINYAYGRDSQTKAETCFHVQGTVDRDIWPTYISWAGGRYQINLVSSARVADTQFDGADNQYGGINGQPRQTRQLDHIQVWSNPTGSWQLVRQYNLGYDYSLRSDALLGTGCPVGMVKCPDNSYPRLTLKSIQRVGNNGTTALPATTFSYGAFSAPLANGTYWSGGPWNRLTTVNNGQGGTITLAYENIGQMVNSGLMGNQRRITARTQTDGRGNSYAWSYAYGTPSVNTLGSTRGPASPWGYGSYGTQAYPNSAVLYYNAFADVLHNSRNWLTHQPMREFRGHDWVQETDPGGGRTKHFFYQGAASDLCTPTVTGGSITGDACFQRLRDGEFLKGKEYRTQMLPASGSALLRETITSFKVQFLDYTTTPLSGLWRAFSYSYQVDQHQYEGGSTALTSSQKTFFTADCSADSPSTVVAAYGNVGCVEEYNDGTLLRYTRTRYLTRNDAGGYIVDRPYQEVTFDGADQRLAISNSFYDNTSNALMAPTLGDLRRVSTVYDIPVGDPTGLTLHTQDSTTTYDSYGNPVTSTSYAGAGTWLFNGTATIWSAPGNGSAARSSTTTYDSVFHAWPTQISNPLSQIERATYDYRMGALTRVTGPNTSGTPTDCTSSVPATEQSTCMVYDVFGRLVKQIKPGDSVSLPTLQAYYYDSELPFRYRYDQRDGTTGGTTRVMQQFYDGMGRQIQTKQEGALGWQNIIVDTRYNGLDQVTAVSQARYVTENATTFYQYTNPGGTLYNDTTTTYDALGRVSVVTAPDNTTTSHFYLIWSDAGTPRLAHNVVDANRHRIKSSTDALGRLVKVEEIIGNCGQWTFSCTAPNTTAWAVYATTSYGYDALDRLKTVTDDADNLTTLSYDGLGRKTRQHDPDLGIWNYTYDVNGNLVTQTDAKSQVLWFGYDALGRQIQKRQTSASGTVLANYAYDVGTYGKGQRTSMSVPGGASTSWTYDARGRKVTATHTVPGLTGTRLFQSGYDNADRLVSQTYPSLGGVVEVLTTSYDAAWRPIQVCTSRGGCYASAATYTALGQPEQWTYGNSVLQDWIYSSPTQRLQRLKVGSGTPASIFDRSYSYDGVSNITAITDNKSAPNNQSYAYDDLNRLKSWTLNGTTQSYAYNTLGNITSKPGVGTYTYPASGPTSTRPHTPSAVNGAAYSYDANGNLTSGGGRTYTWTIDNLPNSISHVSGSESYSYDADGERVKKVAGSVTTVYLEGLWEEVVGGATKVYYGFGGPTIAVRDSVAGLTYLHNDHLGSASVATTTGGTVASSQEYDAWGKVRSGGIGQTTLNFTGQRLDASGLLYYHARMYDPLLGRFVSADSVMPNQNDPQQLNRYSYAGNNPLTNTDPTGHWIESAIDIASIAFDIYDISQNGLSWTSGLALAADIVSLALPVVAGGGVAVRAIAHADDIAAVATHADEAVDALRRADDIIPQYHGTSREAADSILQNGPNLRNANPNADFGKGFYTTSDPDEAANWATRNFGDEGAVVRFDVRRSDMDTLRGHSFDGATPEYQAFVNANRSGASPSHNYDYVSGPILKNPGKYRQQGMRTTGNQTAWSTKRGLRTLRERAAGIE